MLDFYLIDDQTPTPEYDDDPFTYEFVGQLGLEDWDWLIRLSIVDERIPFFDDYRICLNEVQSYFETLNDVLANAYRPPGYRYPSAVKTWRGILEIALSKNSGLGSVCD